MKALHKDNLFCWSQFDQERNIDFHSYLWLNASGNIIFDPLPMSEHDQHHLQTLGNVNTIIISNSDHIRHAVELAAVTGAEIWGPIGEQANFPVACSKWLGEFISVMPGLDVYALTGSKTPGELAFVIEGETLITGDLIRAHSGGKLCLLPAAKLTDLQQAQDAVKRLANLEAITAVLPGDGWPIFRGGKQALSELVATF
ncbi:MAG: hypothetical protein KUG79_14870 [Pseudomonadales bacterium]|nr:hypothetical protein [Pseudomonadales bacterium]